MIRAAQTSPASPCDRLKAFGVAIGTAADKNPELLDAWLGAEAPHITAPLPVAPVDAGGILVPVSTTASEETGWKLGRVGDSWWRVSALNQGESCAARTDSLAVRDEPPGSIAKNYYQQLPVEARYLNGIGWALTMLPDPASAGPFCLRDQLGLIVPPQTISHLESALGPIRVYTGAGGTLRLDFHYQGTDYYLFPEQEGVPGKKSRRTFLISQHQLSNPENTMHQRFPVHLPERWSEVPGGLRGL